MSDQKQASSNNRGLLIGAAVAVAVAGFGGYKVGFGNGEEGLIGLQAKIGELQATASTQASQLETQAETLRTLSETLRTRGEELTSRASEIQTQQQTLEALTAEISDKNSKLQAMTVQLTSADSELSDANGKLSELTTELSETEQQNANYLKTIMAGLTKQDFILHVGGRQMPLIENQVNLGLSYVSREDRTARVTLSGEQVVLKLHDPERITLEGRRCDLNLANLVSDTAAEFELKCDR